MSTRHELAGLIGAGLVDAERPDPEHTDAGQTPDDFTDLRAQIARDAKENR